MRIGSAPKMIVSAMVVKVMVYLLLMYLLYQNKMIAQKIIENIFCVVFSCYSFYDKNIGYNRVGRLLDYNIPIRLIAHLHGLFIKIYIPATLYAESLRDVQYLHYIVFYHKTRYIQDGRYRPNAYYTLIRISSNTFYHLHV